MMTSYRRKDVEATVATSSKVTRTNRTDLYTYSLSGEEYELESNGSDDIVTTSPSIETASCLLEKLLVQLILNDSPPSNDNEDAFNDSRNQPSPTQSRTKKNRSASDVALEQQGNVSLAKLCEFTLEAIGKQPDDTFQSDTSHEKSPEVLRQSKPIIAPNKKKQSLRWMKKKTTNNANGGAEALGKTHYSDILTEGRDASEAHREHQKTTRLQMFGSEYARFLSTTALAPKEIAGHVHKRVVPRRMLKTGIQNIEDADKQVLTGPVTDIIVTRGDEKLPKGYFRVSQSPSGEPFYVGGGKSPLFLCVKKERNWDRAAQRPCVTAVSIIFPDRKEFVPPGFTLVRSPKSDDTTSQPPPVNLNMGGSEPAYLCFRRSRDGNPLTGIMPLFPSRREYIPEGYTVLERTPRNFVATLHSSNVPVFLAYRQRLANLESLRPPPLVMSVLNGDANVTRLESYYCTGGTTVQSKVGRFHIMDRSTHSLLSPSSIKHRLALIKMSRQKTLDSITGHSAVVGEKYSYSDTSSVQSAHSDGVSSHILSNSFGTPGSRTGSIDAARLSSVGDSESVTSSSVMDTSFSSMGQHSHSMVRVDEERVSEIASFTNDQKDLDRCLQALSFIPTISPGSQEIGSDESDTFKKRVSVLIPILTSCYTRHGGSAFLSISGLSDLLRNDFFADDIEMSQDPSSRTTLLDLSIQVACDVATMGAQETQLHACVEFVEEAVKYSCGYLSTRTVGYVHRFLLFVFYFGISSPSGNWGVGSGSDKYLLEDTRFNADKTTLRGGAPQSAILSLKDVIVFMIARLGSQVHFDQCTRRNVVTSKTEDSSSTFQHFEFVDNLVNQAVTDSVFRVDIANFTELAMHQILRSGGSELFWYEMINLCDSGLFGNDRVLREETRHMYAICFALLANSVKVASSKVRKNNEAKGLPRDVANKLMSLEMLKFFLEKWERGLDTQEIPGSHSVSSFAFCIRRLVVPCLLANTADALSDPRIFRRVIQIIGVLWCSPFYRKHMKLEIGILFDHFVLRLLKLGPQILFRSNDSKDTTYVFAQQLELMKEIKNWFLGDSDRILELFLNFDTDYGTQQVGGAKGLLPDLDWKISEQLCSLLCNISEECTEFLGDKIKKSQSSSPVTKSENKNQGYEGMSIATLARESARRLRQGALDAVTQIVKALTVATAESVGTEFSSIAEAWYYGQKYTRKSGTSRSRANTSRPDSALVVDYWKKLGVAKSESVLNDYKKAFTSRADVSERKNNINVAIGISNEKGLMKAVEYLIACNVLPASPREISSFLRVHSADLDATALGHYLGEGGSDHETEFWNQIRYNYIRAVSFVGMTVEEGLRHLLTQGGFRLPGESQQIDRLMSTFSRCYWEDNAGDRNCCPIDNEGMVLLLSFATIMLNTDLHKVIHSSKKDKKKSQVKAMTKDEFIVNLQRAAKGNEIDKGYLSDLYDVIQLNPIVIHTHTETQRKSTDVRSSGKVKICIAQMAANVKRLDALLRGLAIHEYRYFSLEIYRKDVGKSMDIAKLNLSKCLMTNLWHRLHGLINSALKIAHLDPKGMESCTDLLKFSICSTILLDMPTEQIAFLDQLGRFRLFNHWRSAQSVGSAFELPYHDQESFKKEKWYNQMRQHMDCTDEERSTRGHSGKLESLILLGKVVEEMGIETSEIDVDAAGRKIIRDVARRIENAEFLLNDPTRTFVKEGNIIKRANRSGKSVEYRFFLFSDVLIYAKKTKSSSSSPIQYRIHVELPLILMKVIDWFPPSMKKDESKRAIQFYHPRKSFLVLCTSNEERDSWVSDIRGAIAKELERKVAIEMARKAATNIPANGKIPVQSMARVASPPSKQCMTL